MIIWLNGAFGAGKTQTAYELHRRLPHSYVYDPENVGFFLRRNLPSEVHQADFQDYPMWRRWNVELLEYLASEYDGHVIVPMTVTDRTYYEEMVGALSRKYAVKHVILYAPKKILLRRLASRLEDRRSWGARQIDRCIRAFDEEITEEKIDTSQLDIFQTAEAVAARAGIPLAPDCRSGPRKCFDRIVTQVRHIR